MMIIFRVSVGLPRSEDVHLLLLPRAAQLGLLLPPEDHLRPLRLGLLCAGKRLAGLPPVETGGRVACSLEGSQADDHLRRGIGRLLRGKHSCKVQDRQKPGDYQ